MEQSCVPLVIVLLSFVHTGANSVIPTETKCSFLGQCSQICKIEGGCSCIDGFMLGSNGKSCHPIDPNWKLLWCNSTSIGYTHRNGTVADVVSKKINPSLKFLPRAFTYDARNEVMFWINKETTTTSKSKFAVFTNSMFVRSDPIEFSRGGLISPQSVAYDWITRNLYFIEPSLFSITLCPAYQNKACAVVLSKENLSTGRSLILHPNIGIMVWTEEESLNQSIIYTAGMDGRSFSPIFKSPARIASIAVDQGNTRVYWVAEGDFKVTSADFTGENRKTLILNTNQIAAQTIDVFGDNIFWISESQKGITVQVADKYFGQNEVDHPEIEISSDPLDIKGVALYHPANQPIFRSNPCENTNCSNLCVLSPPSEYPGSRCLTCPIVRYTPRNSLICADSSCTHTVQIFEHLQSSDEMVIAYGNTLAFTLLNSETILQRNMNFGRVRLPQIKSITAVSYNAPTDTFILTDSEKIYEYDLKSREMKILFEEKGGNVRLMKVDEIGGNLYWVDSKKGILSVMSLSKRMKITLLNELRNVCDLLIIPEQRLFILATKNTAAGGVDLTSFFMNGSETKFTHREATVRGCVKITYAPLTSAILWIEMVEASRIGRINLHPDGSMPFGIEVGLPKEHTHFPSSIVSSESVTIWADSKDFIIYRYASNSEVLYRNQIMPEGELCRVKHESLFKIKLVVINKSRNEGIKRLHDQICGQRKCSHVCLATGSNSSDTDVPSDMCHCSFGYFLDQNGKTCILEKHRESDPSSMMATIVSVSFASLVLISVILGLLLWYKWRCIKRRPEPLSDIEMAEFFTGYYGNSSSAAFGCTPYNRQLWEISKNSFTRESDQPLATGKYGAVHKATVFRNGTPVVTAMKSCFPDSPFALRKLLTEIKIMCYLGKHENIIQFIGAYTFELDNGLVQAFLEFCELGSLLSYLRRGKSEQELLPSLEEMNQWTKEIANGMSFLAEKKFVHMDLAAKNILLTSNKTAKISGFGCSRKVDKESGNNEPLPRGWMAPESLARMEFTEKSDVWAFGIVMWEIFSIGKNPFEGLSRKADFASRLSKGLRLEKPVKCEDTMYSIMLQCWTVKADLRPTFALLKQDLICTYASIQGLKYGHSHETPTNATNNIVYASLAFS